MTERIRQAKAAGREILPLASGDPNLRTDPSVIEAAHQAMLAGDTHYGPAPGTPQLRAAISKRLAGRTQSRFSADQIIVTPGGKFAVYAALMATVMPGDEVIIFDPSWVSYVPCVKLCGGTAVVLPALHGIALEQVAEAINARTRAIIVNSPVNPTGRVLSADELKGLARLARQHDLWLIFDQVYSDLTFEGEFAFLQDLPDAQGRTLVADSLSKTYGMTGWRVGYLAVPSAAVKPILRVIQHSIYCVPPFIQAAATVALGLPEAVIEKSTREFKRRRDRASAGLNRINGIVCKPPPATFYLFPSVTGDDRQVAQEWLETMSIAALPGSAFGAAGGGHLRLSLACDDSVMDEALARLEKRYGRKDR
jgi:aspartate aminotransferase